MSILVAEHHDFHGICQHKSDQSNDDKEDGHYQNIYGKHGDMYNTLPLAIIIGDRNLSNERKRRKM